MVKMWHQWLTISAILLIFHSKHKYLTNRRTLGYNRGLLQGGAWRSLVAHLVWDQGVEGSNPFAPTIRRGVSLWWV